MTSGLTESPIVMQFDNLQTESNTSNNLKIKILNLNNDVVYSDESDTVYVQIPNLNLPSGEYQLQIRFNDQNQVRAFTIL